MSGGKKTSGLAIATLVLGLLGIIPAALICGYFALKQTRPGKKKGRGLVIAGFVATGLWILVIIILVIAGSFAADRDDSGKINKEGFVSASDLRVGDCVKNAAQKTGKVARYEAVRCNKPHDSEVYTVIALEGDKYPGEKFVIGKGQRGCRARLRRQHPIAYNDRDVGFNLVYPTDDTWDGGDHQITCLATYKMPRTGKLER